MPLLMHLLVDSIRLSTSSRVSACTALPLESMDRINFASSEYNVPNLIGGRFCFFKVVQSNSDYMCIALLKKSIGQGPGVSTTCSTIMMSPLMNIKSDLS